MKVPKYIRDKMSRGAYLHAKASEEVRKVEVWCETHGFDVDILRSALQTYGGRIWKKGKCCLTSRKLKRFFLRSSRRDSKPGIVRT